MVSGTRKGSKLTPQARDTVCKIISLGVSLEAAAASADVGRETFFGWLRRGRAALRDASAHVDVPDGYEYERPDLATLLAVMAESEREYAQLAHEVECALGKAEAGYTLKIAKAADRDWRAAAWWLERRRPELYGARTGEQSPTAMSNDELVAELNELGFVQATVVEANASAAADAGPGNDNALPSGAAEHAQSEGGDDGERKAG